MDVFKIFAPNDVRLTEQLKLVKRYSNDIEMEFGLDKCVKCTFVQGRPTKTHMKNQPKYNNIVARQRRIMQMPWRRRGPPIMSQKMHKTIAKEKNEDNHENIPLPKK